MSKVIVERPRIGHSGRWTRAGKTRALLDEADDPLRARAPVRDKPVKTKSLNENLAPLKRFLQSRVGRPWNKVYAEISEHLRPSNAVQQHVRDHLEDFVALHARMENGKVVAQGRFGGHRDLADSSFRFYVHPKTGLLKESPYWKGRAQRFHDAREAAVRAAAANRREIAEFVQWHMLNDGQWWEVRLKPGPAEAAPGPHKPLALRDAVLLAGLSTLSPRALYGRANVYAAEIAKLTKAEKKAHGLK
ncbi:MAG: hypothetical protein AB7O04_03920 [Hyphomonadaceae bacterium]